MRKFNLPELKQMFHLLIKLYPLFKVTSVKIKHDKITMNQDSPINSILTARNITQTITNIDVPSTSKENTKNKLYIENESNTIWHESADREQPNENPKSKRKSVTILGDNMIQHSNTETDGIKPKI